MSSRSNIQIIGKPKEQTEKQKWRKHKIKEILDKIFPEFKIQPEGS